MSMLLAKTTRATTIKRNEFVFFTPRGIFQDYHAHDRYHSNRHKQRQQRKGYFSSRSYFPSSWRRLKQESTSNTSPVLSSFQQRQRRKSSSSDDTISQAQDDVDVGKKKQKKSVVVYQRDYLTRNRIPRLALGVSTLNTFYWVWYTLDFIPSINQYHDTVASQQGTVTEVVHVNPAIGMGGLALGIVIQSILSLYATSLIHRLELVMPASSYEELSDSTMKKKGQRNNSENRFIMNHDDYEWRVYRSSFVSWIRGDSHPSHEPVPLGDLQLNNRQSPEVLELLEWSSSPDTTAVKPFKGGHLGLTTPSQRLPWLLEIRTPEKELEEQDLFLDQLVFQNNHIKKEDATNKKKKSSPTTVVKIENTTIPSKKISVKKKNKKQKKPNRL